MSRRNARRRDRPYVSRELTHFLGRKEATDEARYGLLLKIIQSGILKPSGPEDGISVHPPLFGAKPQFSKETLSEVPAVCFCDIPHGSLSIHVGKYGRFGLAFDKALLISRGANPVFYVAIDGELPIHPKGKRGAHFDELLNDISMLTLLPMDRDSKLSAKNKESLRRVTDFLWHHVLGFAKPFDALSALSAVTNTYMEREWRLLGRFEFEVKDIRRIFLPRAFSTQFGKAMPSC